MFESLSGYAVVWGIALAAGALASSFLSSFTALSFHWRSGTHGVVTLIALLAMFLALDREIKPGLTVREIIRRGRHVVMLILAGVVGYYWHGFDHATSQQGRNEKAALWACAQTSACRAAAKDYGERTGGYADILPAKQMPPRN